MRIGLLITSIGNFGQKGFYNSQEIGLSKELDRLFDEVLIYKAVPLSEKYSTQQIEGCSHSTLFQLPVKSKGINADWDCNIMDKSLDYLLYFSDTQLAVPKVYKWCKENNIKMFPYIGVVESHSVNRIKRWIMNLLFKRNIHVYKKCTCFVKTPTVERRLLSFGIKRTVVLPVGLDTSLLYQGYDKVSISALKNKYGYAEEDRVILFIGRFIDEKQPLRIIEILHELKKNNQNYKLLMVGSGELRSAIDKMISKINLIDDVKIIDRIPNSSIWELYRLADTFVNLNQQEIFGMAILEAMYYECKVIAWHAPGPDFIIKTGETGYLVQSNDEIIKSIKSTRCTGVNAHKCIVNSFTWETSARKLANILKDNKYYDRN